MAAELFNEKGFAATSMKDIMNASQKSKGAIYGHFPGGKLDIALAAYDFAVEQVYDQVGERTRVVSHSLDKLIAVIDYYRDHIFDPPVRGGCPIQNTLVHSYAMIPELKQRVDHTVSDWKRRIIKTLDKGVESGEVLEKVNFEELALQFIGQIQGGLILAKSQNTQSAFDIVVEPVLTKLELIRNKK